jgi:hypothetical protein
MHGNAPLSSPKGKQKKKKCKKPRRELIDTRVAY